jgi:tRNA-dihydrouridine synthase
MDEGDPPSASASVSVPERVAAFLRHAHMAAAEKGESVATRELRKHVGWYFKGCRGVAVLRAKVKTAKDLDRLIEAVNAFAASACCATDRTYVRQV